MKIVKLILFGIALLALYIFAPIWMPIPSNSVSEIDQQIQDQQERRKQMLAAEAIALSELERKFGPKPSTAYQSRVPVQVQAYWDKTLKSDESVYEEICSPLKASEKGWSTSCQYKIKSPKGSSALLFDTYTINHGKLVR